MVLLSDSENSDLLNNLAAKRMDGALLTLETICRTLIEAKALVTENVA